MECVEGADEEVPVAPARSASTATGSVHHDGEAAPTPRPEALAARLRG